MGGGNQLKVCSLSFDVQILHCLGDNDNGTVPNRLQE